MNNKLWKNYKWPSIWDIRIHRREREKNIVEGIMVIFPLNLRKLYTHIFKKFNDSQAQEI